MRTWLSTHRVAVVVGLIALSLFAAGVAWGVSQPWTANHFGYALTGQDGLPAYIHENGRRYHSEQVCAGAAWCHSQRVQMGLPRCYTQADLQGRFQEWPLTQVDTMPTLFGVSHSILQRTGDRGLTTPYIIADGSDCYVMYELEGGP